MPARGAGPRRRGGGGSPAGAGILLLALVFLVAAAVALPIFRPGAERADTAARPSDGTPLATPLAAVSVGSSPPSAAPVPSAAPQPPTPQATAFQPPRTVVSPFGTPRPTAAPTQPPTPRPTPRPTERPTPTPTPRPPAEVVSLLIEDGQFGGDYDGRGSGRYQGRTVAWVYGQGTPYHTMSATFRLKRTGEIGRRASLAIVGLDGGDEGKSRIAIVLNGSVIYRGRNPLPDDRAEGDPGPVEWGRAVFRLRGELLRRNNELSIVNLEPSSCTLCPTFVMVDSAELTYRLRP